MTTTTSTLKWKTNSNVKKPGLSNKNRCVKNRVRDSMSHSELKAGGTKHRQYIHIHIKSDNTTAVAYFKKWGGGGGVRSELLLQITKQILIWTHCLSKTIMIIVEHLPEIQNVQADLESRQVRNNQQLDAEQ